MKTLHLSILVISFVAVLILPHTAFGIDQVNHSTLEKQFGNITTTKLYHDGSVLILNQTTQKSAYKMGENITINAQLINMGNKTVEIAYCEPWVALEIKNQTGDEVWPNSQVVCIPEFYGTKTLHPGERISILPWRVTFAPYSFLQPKLSIPGNYTVMSVAILTFDMNPKNIRFVEPLWSKPISISILPEVYLQNETNSTNQTSSNVTGISNHMGKDIVLDTPSDITKSKYKLDPQKEKLAREKQQILVDTLIFEEERYGGFQNRTQNFPWSGISYDYVDNALEVHILPEFFNADAFPKYFEKIRSIVGNDIDVAISPLPYAEHPDGYSVIPVILIIITIIIVASIIVFLFVRKKK